MRWPTAARAGSRRLGSLAATRRKASAWAGTACPSSERESPVVERSQAVAFGEAISSTAPRYKRRISFRCATKTPNFREDDPLLSTKTGASLISDLPRRPLPVADLGQIFAVLADIELVALADLVKALGGGVDQRPELGDTADDVEDQLEAIHAIEDGHVEGSRGGSLLDVTADVDVVVITPAIGEAMDQRGIAVEGEQDGLVGSEQGVEVFIGQAVRMFGDGLQGHQVHDVDDADAKVGDIFAEQGHGSENFESGNIAGAGHDNVGRAFVVAGPLPGAESRGAMADCGVHVQPVGRGLLSGADEIDIVAAAQAVIGDREQAIRVGRKINADHVGFFVSDVVDEAGVLVGETIVVLAPDMGGEQVVEGSNGLTPGNGTGGLQPFGVLVEHGVDDVNEGFVAREQAVAAGEEIALEPALAHVLAEDLHHPAVGGEMFVDGEGRSLPGFAGDFEDGVQAVGRGFVGAEEAKISRAQVAFHDVAQKAAKNAGGFGDRLPGGFHFDAVAPELRQMQGLEENSAIGVGIHAHAALSFGRKVCQGGDQRALGIEELLGFVAAHPVFEDFQMPGFFVEFGERHLVGAPGSFDRFAVDRFGAGPAFGRAENEHRPARACPLVVLASGLLDGGDFVEDVVEQGGHFRVHHGGIVAFENVGRIAVAAEQGFEFFLRDARQHRGICDFVAVEMKDRQDGAVFGGIQKLVGVPAGGAVTSLGFAIADDATDDQIRIVERGAVGVEQGVAELSAFMNGARSFRSDVAWDAVRPGKLAEQAFDSVAVELDVRIGFGVGTFQIAVREDAGAAVTRTNDADHVEIAAGDQPVEVRVDEVQARSGAPVPEKTRLYVVEGERAVEERIVLEIDLTYGEIVCGAPVGVHPLEQRVSERDDHAMLLRRVWSLSTQYLTGNGR